MVWGCRSVGRAGSGASRQVDSFCDTKPASPVDRRCNEARST